MPAAARVESRLFPDQILPQVARLRPLYVQHHGLFEQETNPLVARRPPFGSRRRATRNSAGSRPDSRGNFQLRFRKLCEL